MLFVLVTTAQEKKHLTLENAVLGYYKGLYPKNKQVQWVKGVQKTIAFQEKGILYKKEILKKKTQKTTIVSLKMLQKSIPSLKRMPYYFSTITNDKVYFTHKNSVVCYNYKKKKLTYQIKYPKNAANIDFNTQAKKVAYTIDHNLYYATAVSPKIAITHFKDKNIVAGQAIARSEFGITKGIFWSPKGNFMAFYQKDESKVTEYPLVDVTTTPAKVTPIKYPMNDMGSEIAKIGIFNPLNQSVIYLDIDTSDEHYLTNLSWSLDEKLVLVAEVNRGQNHYALNAYDIATGKKVTTILEEKNDRWVEPENDAVFIPNKPHQFLWLSEKDGFKNLYLYDVQKGFVKQLTHFKWVIKSILGFDASKKCVIISGTGNDARNTKVFKVRLSNGKTTELTKESGVHSVQLSTDGNYFIDSYSAIDVPRIIKIKSINSSKESTYFKADNPLKDYQLGTTEFVDLTADNGVKLHGRIIKPANFDASKKYPVLIYVYGGPHAQLVTNRWLGGSNLWMQWMAAEQDYVVFTVDNQGSAYRGFAFESIIHRQVGEQEMKDQLTGVNYLKSLPFVDGSRMAVHGWSFGGFMTNSLMLRHPGVFTTAVAGGPVTDWRYYEVMYGERYMDRYSENKAGFEKNRLHNYVQNLEGKLLEIIGSVDPVVVPQHTMTLLKSFVKANKQVDFFTYPMHPHNVRGRDRVHLMTKVLNYIIRWQQ